jgi:hypothetical protein
MALIDCEECGVQVSDKAPACIKCGAPLNSTLTALGPAAGIVTTQQTGKRYKGAQLIGAVMMCAGVISCSAHEPGVAAGLTLVGLVVFLGARMGAWWNHG